MATAMVKVWFIECAGFKPDECAETASMHPYKTVSEARIIFARWGWIDDKVRGWMCPTCARKRKAQLTREATKARTAKTKAKR